MKVNVPFKMTEKLPHALYEVGGLDIWASIFAMDFSETSATGSTAVWKFSAGMDGYQTLVATLGNVYHNRPGNSFSKSSAKENAS